MTPFLKYYRCLYIKYCAAKITHTSVTTLNTTYKKATFQLLYYILGNIIVNTGCTGLKKQSGYAALQK